MSLAFSFSNRTIAHLHCQICAIAYVSNTVDLLGFEAGKVVDIRRQNIDQMVFFLIVRVLGRVQPVGSTALAAFLELISELCGLLRFFGQKCDSWSWSAAMFSRLSFVRMVALASLQEASRWQSIRPIPSPINW